MNRERFITVFSVMLVSVLFSTLVSAFTFSDGSSTTCVDSNGRAVEEAYLSELAAIPVTTTLTAITRYIAGGGFRISFNNAKLKALPPEVRDFLYFHECAHAHVPVSDEVVANCVGVIDLRKAGRSSPAIEEQLGQFHVHRRYMGARYGMGGEYWKKTMDYVNSGSPPISFSEAGVGTKCYFDTGPRRGLTRNYAPRPPLEIGSRCFDGAGSFGHVIK